MAPLSGKSVIMPDERFFVYIFLVKNLLLEKKFL